MRSSRTRRKSGLAVVFGGLRRGLVVGALIALALRADLPKRLLELVQSLTGATSGTRGQGGQGEPSGTDAGDAARGDTAGVAGEAVETGVESGNVGASAGQGADSGTDGSGEEEAAALDVEPGSSTEAGQAAGYKEPDAGADPGTDAAAASDVSTEAGEAAGYDAPESGSGTQGGAEAIAVASTVAGEAPGYGDPDLDLAAVTDVRDEDDVAPGLAYADVESIDVEPDLPEPDVEPTIVGGEVGQSGDADETGEDGPTDLGTDTTGDVERSGWSVVDEADDAALERAGITGKAVDSAGDPIDETDGEEPEPVADGGGEPVMPHVATDVDDAVPGDGTTECPEEFPVKGNDRSRLYHMPDGSAYARTKAEVCFRTPEAAERAGYRRAKG